MRCSISGRVVRFREDVQTVKGPMSVAVLAIPGKYRDELQEVLVRRVNGTQPGQDVTVEVDVAVRQPKEPGHLARLSVFAEEI